MPYYDYECTECGKQFTVEQSMKEHTEQRKPKCPKCNKSRPVQRLLASVHVQTSKKS